MATVATSTSWVRVRIIDPDSQIIDSRDLDDSWYALGGHRHPEQKQEERDRTAGAELREWLARNSRAPGPYTVLVTALDSPGGEPGRVWANVKVHHRAAVQDDPAVP